MFSVELTQTQILIHFITPRHFTCIPYVEPYIELLHRGHRAVRPRPLVSVSIK